METVLSVCVRLVISPLSYEHRRFHSEPRLGRSWIAVGIQAATIIGKNQIRGTATAVPAPLTRYAPVIPRPQTLTCTRHVKSRLCTHAPFTRVPR